MRIRDSFGVRTLVGRIKFVDHRASEDDWCALDQARRTKKLMRLLMLICLQLSKGPFVVNKVVSADFGIPSASFTCEHGTIGVALLQDEETSILREAVIHLSGRASAPDYKNELVEEQHIAINLIKAIANELGLQSLTW